MHFQWILTLLELFISSTSSKLYEFCSNAWCSEIVHPAFQFGGYMPILSLLIAVTIFGTVVTDISVPSRSAKDTIEIISCAYALYYCPIWIANFSSASHGSLQITNRLLRAIHSVFSIILIVLNIKYSTKSAVAIPIIGITGDVLYWAAYTLELIHIKNGHRLNEREVFKTVGGIHARLMEIRKQDHGDLVEDISCEPQEKSVYPGAPRRKETPAEQKSWEAKLWPHFFRCYCCIDDAAITSNMRRHTDEEARLWPQTEPEMPAFLRKERKLHTSARLAQKDNSQQHRLCRVCEWVCSDSKILKFRGPFNPRHHFTFDPQERERESYEHHATAEALKASAQQGCHLCNLIWASLSPEQQERLLVADIDLGSRFTGDTEDIRKQRRIRLVIETFFGNMPPTQPDHILQETHPLDLTMSVKLKPHFGGCRMARRWSPKNELSENKRFYEGGEYARPIYVLPSLWRTGCITSQTFKNTGTDETIEYIKDWLQSTEPITRESNFVLPGRLIDVQNSGRTGFVRVRSSEEAKRSNPHDLRYVALSHCWGKTEFLTLQTTNITEFSVRVAISRMPKNFQEAIEVTSKLKVPFIWIDSLCIIQNDGKDWKIEAAKMKDVYRCATFTIVAASAVNSSGGLFRDQNPLLASPCLVSIQSSPFQKPVLHYALPSHLDTRMLRNTDIESTTWNSRGWCLQERYLSPRLVYFSELQVHLESKDIHGSLAQYRELKSQYDWIRCFKENPRLRGSSFQLKKRQVPILVRWWEYVTEYSKRNLTKNSDRPVAIEGLAKLLISKNTESDALPTIDEIVGGIYPQLSNTFTLDLLWYVERGRKPRPNNLFPSWSWTSVYGEVNNPSAGSSCLDTLIKVNDFDMSSYYGMIFIDKKTVTPMLLPGCVGLKLQGRLRKAKWSKPANDLFYSPRQSSTDALFYYNDTVDHSNTASHKGNEHLEDFALFKPVAGVKHMGPAVYHLLNDRGKQVGWIVPDTDDELPREVYCLKFLVEPATEREKMSLASTWTVRGLALQPCGRGIDSLNPRHFKRVGYFELDQPVSRIRNPNLAEVLENNRQEWKSRYPVVREPPAIDPSGFFSEERCEEKEIVIW